MDNFAGGSLSGELKTLPLRAKDWVLKAATMVVVVLVVKEVEEQFSLHE